MWKKSTCPLIASALLMLGGCAYEYNLVEPAEYARHVGSEPTRLSITPLEYQMRSYDDRLILRINNPTEDTIRLLGEESVVVDPDGMSHPVHGDVIAPHSYISRVLPPLRHAYYEPGPAVGFGVGFGGGGYHHGGWGGGGIYYGGPAYYAVEEPYTPYFWNWGTDHLVHLTLVYDRNGHVFHDTFGFRRTRE